MSVDLIAQLLSGFPVIPHQSMRSLLPHCKLIQVKPNQVLVPDNTFPMHWYLVHSGLLRAVFITQQGKEFSKEFYWEKDIILGIRSLISPQPIPYSVVAVEKCELIQLPLTVYRKLVSEDDRWKDFHIQQLESHLLFKEIKEELLLLNSNQQMVSSIYQNLPDFVKRVPATLLASYLGLSPVSLSRIKKRLKL